MALGPHNLPEPDASTYPILMIPYSGDRIAEYEKCYRYDHSHNKVYFWKAKEERS